MTASASFDRFIYVRILSIFWSTVIDLRRCYSLDRDDVYTCVHTDVICTNVAQTILIT